VGYRIPGITENPSLGKIKLCKAASGMHSNFIDKYVTAGIILSHKKASEGQYTFFVDKKKWNNELFESQEVVAIGGWCKVANKNGRGEVYIYDNKNKEVIGSVVDGNYEV
tara:strand:+ start:339 stop:668 length:330 start_codon:yes stop_codon:yes gene_type:complete